MSDPLGVFMETVPTSAVHIATIPGVNRPWERLRPHTREYRFPPGHYLELGGSMRRDFYYLAQGRLTILHGSANGKFRNMLYLAEGNLLNVAEVLGYPLTEFTDPGRQFYCLDGVCLWRFPGSLLHDQPFIREHPDLIENLLSSLGVKLLIMHNTLSNAGTGHTATRICRFALNLSLANGNSLELNPGISQEELANLLGVHRITLLRSLQKLKQAGVILELTSSCLRIGDRRLLQKWASA